MSSAELSNWNQSYILYPNYNVYPSTDTFPGYNDEVTNSTSAVYGYLGSKWDRVTDTSAYEDILQATSDLTDAIGKIPVALENVTRSSDGKSVNGAVVEEIIARYVTGQEGEFVKLTGSQIAANSIEASHISAGSIDGMVITGAKIQTSGTGLRVTLDDTGLYSYNSRGETTFRMSSKDGSVYIRGNVGISDSWSTTRFINIINSGSGGDAAADGFRYGSGLFFQVDDANLPQHGVVSLIKAPNKSNYDFPNQYGIRIQTPRNGRFSVHENGMEFMCADLDPTYYRRWGFDPRGFYGKSAYYGVVFACYDKNPVGGDAGFWAYAPNVDQNSNRTYHVSGTKNNFFAYSDKYLLKADNENFLWRSAYNTAVSRLIHGGMDFSFFHMTHSAGWMGLGWTTSSNTTRTYRSKLYIVGNDADSGLVANRTSAMLKYGGNQAYVNANGFYVYNTTKNFIMAVPELSEARGGMLLKHSTTESPGAGIEYWHTEEIPESGLLLWTLPEYVPYIAADYGSHSVFVTTSSGHANAVLHDDLEPDSGWYVEVRGEPGATANVLVKLNRIVGGADGGWDRTPWIEWVMPSSGSDARERTIDGDRLGPLPEYLSKLVDRDAEERLLLDNGVDPADVREKLAEAGMTDAPLMFEYDIDAAVTQAVEE